MAANIEVLSVGVGTNQRATVHNYQLALTVNFYTEINQECH